MAGSIVEPRAEQRRRPDQVTGAHRDDLFAVVLDELADAVLAVNDVWRRPVRRAKSEVLSA